MADHKSNALQASSSQYSLNPFMFGHLEPSDQDAVRLLIEIRSEQHRYMGYGEWFLGRAIQQRDDLLAALQAAEAHIAELREAWRSGAIDERDGQGGTRSNRNADVHHQICAAIRRATEGQ